MRRRRWWWGPVLLLTVLASLWAGRGMRAEATSDDVLLARRLQTTAADFAQGQAEGTQVTEQADGEVQLAENAGEGWYTSPVWKPAFPCRAAGLLYRATVPPGGTLSLALRGGDEAGDWEPWVALPAGPWTSPDGRAVGESLVAFAGGEQVQYRAYLGRGRNGSPVLEDVEVVCLSTEGPAVAAVPAWRTEDGRTEPLPPEEWGGQVVPLTATVTASLRLEVRPAVLSLGEKVEPAPALRMLQRFYQEALAADDLPYLFLVDAAGGVYRGRAAPAGTTAYLGLLGAHPQEAVSPTMEDGLLSLLDLWGGPLLAEGVDLTLATPAGPSLAERLWSRWQAGNLRRGEWVLAQGTAAEGVHTWILLSNPTSERTRVVLELFPQDGRAVQYRLSVAGESRASLFANRLLGPGDFWARLEADEEVLVERALYFGHDADDVAGQEALSRVWYLPGGSQEPGFSTTLTLVNPWGQVVTATVTAFAPTGTVPAGVFSLAPQSRLDLPLARIYAGAAPVGSRVTATAPIAAAQAVRFAGSTGGYGLPGSPLLARRWLLAGVDTVSPCVTLLTFLNPQEEPVPITVTLMSEDGTTLQRTYVVLPGEQVLNVNQVLPDLALAAEVRAARPVAVARVTFFHALQSAHAAMGAARPARRWFLPEGSTAEPFETLLLVTNPNAEPVGLRLNFAGVRGALGQQVWWMPAHARLTIALNEVLPGQSALAVEVEADRPVVVERVMYLHGRQGGHAGLGIPR